MISRSGDIRGAERGRKARREEYGGQWRRREEQSANALQLTLRHNGHLGQLVVNFEDGSANKIDKTPLALCNVQLRPVAERRDLQALRQLLVTLFKKFFKDIPCPPYMQLLVLCPVANIRTLENDLHQTCSCTFDGFIL